ncbi:hypothetical protein LEP3755_51000 [Leptolyngbya sp. NIES-3755]|nr:hypothetical protein LEP3755_51000 [Leptolyngbya sp. NIES-3755]
MLQRLPNLIVACLLLGSSLPLQSLAIAQSMPVIDSSFNSSDSKPSAKENLTNTAIERRLPSLVQDEIKRIAGNHFQLSLSRVLITKVEPQTFSDSCLGLGNLAESCLQQTFPGYRVTAIGKTNQRQVYRISNDARIFRTEAIAGLPVRTDELPTAIARRIFQTARTDLKQPIANLNITEVEKTFDCFRYPNASCLPMKHVNGWKVTVTNYQQLMTYTINLDGTILSKKLL